MGDYTEHLISMAGGDGEPDKLDLDAIQARADAAAEGPWRIERHDLSLYVQSEDEGLQAKLGYVGNRPDGDAEFIAHARTDVPALLALVREQQARIDEARELHQPFTRHFLSPPAGSLQVCHACHESYPCPTIAALTATEGAA